MVERLRGALELPGGLLERQFSFTKQRSTLDAMEVVRDIVEQTNHGS